MVSTLEILAMENLATKGGEMSNNMPKEAYRYNEKLINKETT